MKIISLLSLLPFLRFYDSTNEGEPDYRSCCALKRVSIKSQRYVTKTIANQNRAVDFQIFSFFMDFYQTRQRWKFVFFFQRVQNILVDFLINNFSRPYPAIKNHCFKPS